MEPLSIVTDQSWSGNDGPWSPFLIGYGTPAQFVKSLISTSTPQPYVVIPGGCIPSDPPGCQIARGGIFQTNESSTWQNLGIYELVFEQNLAINDAGDFGFDNITLGVPGSGAPSIEHQIVVGIVAKDYFLASWGLRPAPTNFSNLDTPVPSLLQSLKAANEIPSLSWSYTAGSYQVSQVNKFGHGSLTLGGYDANRFEANNVSFVMASDTNRDLVVGLISVQTADTSESLLPEPILIFLDSGVSHIWLPLEACQRFETAFDLIYDSDLDLYLVNDTAHEALLARNAAIAFTVSNSLAISATSTPVTINLPYSSFDLRLTEDYPGNNGTKNYFPIRRAANSSQYTLGRTFFQNAYVIADYERSTFSVHNAFFPATNGVQNLQAIFPATNGSSTGISAGAIAGIVVGSLVLVIALLRAVTIMLRAKRRTLRQTILLHPQDIKVELDNQPGFLKSNFELHEDVRAIPELSNTTIRPDCELAAEEVANEKQSNNRSRFELQG